MSKAPHTPIQDTAGYAHAMPRRDNPALTEITRNITHAIAPHLDELYALHLLRPVLKTRGGRLTDTGKDILRTLDKDGTLNQSQMAIIFGLTPGAISQQLHRLRDKAPSREETLKAIRDARQ